MSADSTSPAPKKASRLKTLLSRLTSTFWLWLLIGSALVLGQPILFYVILLLLTVQGLIELFHLLQFPTRRGEAIVTSVIASVYVTICFWSAAQGGGIDFGIFDTAAICVAIAAGFFIQMTDPVKPGQSHVSVMACVFAFMYIAYLLNFVTRIAWFDDGHPHSAPVIGRTYVLFLLAVTKCSDTGAYLVGSAIGKHPAVPHISPGKTWEGFLGAVAFAFGTAFLITTFLGPGVPLLTPKHTAILAALLSIGAILGDLAESTLKRSLRAKDSGHVMPGIGGVLDLIDSILFTAPILYFYLLWLQA